MNFFDDDTFEELFRDFFSPRKSTRRHNAVIKGEEEDRTVDFIETKDSVYLIFEIPGYKEEDTSVSIKGNELIIKAAKKNCEQDGVQNYLTEKLCKGLEIIKTLPKFINPNNPSYTMRNGVLEITFNKKFLKK